MKVLYMSASVEFFRSDHTASTNETIILAKFNYILSKVNFSSNNLPDIGLFHFITIQVDG